MSKYIGKRNFRTSNAREVLDAVLESDDDDDDSDESDFLDISESSECSSDGETQLEDDTEADDTETGDTQSDDDMTASADNSSATSASNAMFTWSERATVSRQRLPFTGSPGRKVDVDDTGDPLQYFQLFVGTDLLALIVRETNIQAAVLSESKDTPA